MTWKKPDASLPNKRAAFFLDGGAPLAPTHLVAAVSADLISEELARGPAT